MYKRQGVNSVKANEEDEAKIQKIQMGMAMSNPAMGAGVLVDAQSDAMRTAAANEGGMGAAFGFMGMNMAGAAGGMNASNLYGMAGQQQQQMPQQAPAPAPAPAPQPAGWKCAECGTGGNTGKFCANCGKPAPAPAAEWTCAECGTKNTGKFCANCGKPAPAADWTCSECGTKNKGKFCANCGHPRP